MRADSELLRGGCLTLEPLLEVGSVRREVETFQHDLEDAGNAI